MAKRLSASSFVPRTQNFGKTLALGLVAGKISDQVRPLLHRSNSIGYWLSAISSGPLGEPCSIRVDNDGEDDNATGNHLPHKISNTHQD